MEKEKETDDECLVHLLASQACVCVCVCGGDRGTLLLAVWTKSKTVFHANTKPFLCFQCFMHTDTWISHFCILHILLTTYCHLQFFVHTMKVIRVQHYFVFDRKKEQEKTKQIVNVDSFG